MTVKITPGQLNPPVTPKLDDLDVERMRREFDDKIKELQDLTRQTIAALHAAAIAGF